MTTKKESIKTAGELISERDETRRLDLEKKADRMRLEDIHMEIENKLADLALEFSEIGIDDIEMTIYSDVGTIHARYMDFVYRKEGLI